MERLDRTAVTVLRQLFAAQPTSEAKVLAVWKLVAGPTLARAASVEWDPKGTLFVRARSEAWRTELVRARGLLTARLADLLGPDAVRALVISHGRSDASGLELQS